MMLYNVAYIEDCSCFIFFPKKFLSLYFYILSESTATQR